MKSFIKALKSFAADQKGATAIEYALLAALIGAAIVTAAGVLGGNISDQLDAIATSLE